MGPNDAGNVASGRAAKPRPLPRGDLLPSRRARGRVKGLQARNKPALAAGATHFKLECRPGKLRANGDAVCERESEWRVTELTYPLILSPFHSIPFFLTPFSADPSFGVEPPRRLELRGRGQGEARAASRAEADDGGGGRLGGGGAGDPGGGWPGIALARHHMGKRRRRCGRCDARAGAKLLYSIVIQSITTM